MTVKSRIWWAFLTGTATKCRKITVVPGGPSSHSLTLMWSISIRFVHQVQLKTELVRSEICDFSSAHLKAMIYGARWKSHECPTRALNIPEVEPYLCDENKIAPTQISSLYAFLTLAHKARKAHHHLKRFLRDELQSLLPWGLYLKWNDA